MNPGMPDGAIEPRPEGGVVEWFRTEPRPSLHATLLPAILCVTLGWLLLVVVGHVVASRRPYGGAPFRATLPRAAIVDAHGDPTGGDAITAGERSLALFGTLLVMVSPLVLVLRLRQRGRAAVTELILRTDALVLREAGEERCVPWSELEEARLAPGSGGEPPRVALFGHDGPALEVEARFTGITPEELVRRIRAVRGRALFGLLEPPSWPERARDR